MPPGGTGERWNFGELELFTSSCPMSVKELALFDVVSYETILRAVQAWVAQPEPRSALVDVCRRLSLRFDPAPPATANIRLAEAILGAFRNGDLYLLRRTLGGGGAEKEAAAKAKKDKKNQAAPTEAPAREKTWIEIQLIDQNDRPVGNRKYRLKITDGSFREGTLGADGVVRATGIDPGTCEICFLDLDSSEWRSA